MADRAAVFRIDKACYPMIDAADHLCIDNEVPAIAHRIVVITIDVTLVSNGYKIWWRKARVQRYDLGPDYWCTRRVLECRGHG